MNGDSVPTAGATGTQGGSVPRHFEEYLRRGWGDA